MASHDIEVFFDGDCPLCRREIAMLRRRDRDQRIRFTDIAAAGFDARALGTDQATLMGRIHGRLPDGTWIDGVEVFRRLYAAVGLGWLVSLTRLPVLSRLVELAYDLFARHRLRLTGRCPVDGSCALRRDGAQSPERLRELQSRPVPGPSRPAAPPN
jgi:predicted DCC family thiol-disulfide oxidoreductase YuxK